MRDGHGGRGVMQSLPDFLQHWSRARGDHPAVIDGERAVSFAQLAHRVEVAARRLTTLDVRRGDHVALLLRGGAEMVVLLHAVTRVGAVALPLHRRLTVPELEWQLRDSRAALLCYDATSRDEARSLAVPRLCVGADALAGDRGLESLSASTFESTQPAVAGVHTLVYTSGSSGRPKAVALTWGNHFWSAIGSACNLGMRPDDRWLACLPFAHVGGLSILLRSLVYGTTVLIQHRFDPGEVNRAIDRQSVTIVSLVANMLQRTLEERGQRPFPDSLRCVLLGGGPAPRALLELCAERGVPVMPTYGLTEAASQVTTMPPGDVLRKIGSSGRPLATSRIRIVKGGHDVATGEVGEILVRGPTVSTAILDRCGWRDGWLRTGDLGKWDDEGFLYVLGRRDDTIITGGENVHPIEVETALESHPSVAEACVVGDPDPEWGQVVSAHVRLRRNESVTVDELQAHARRRLAGFKVPRRVVFVDDLPRTPSGKVARRAVAER